MKYSGKSPTLLRLLSNLNDFDEICAASENPYFWERRELLKLEYLMVEKLDDDDDFMKNRCKIIQTLLYIKGVRFEFR